MVLNILVTACIPRKLKAQNYKIKFLLNFSIGIFLHTNLTFPTFISIFCGTVIQRLYAKLNL